MRSAGLFGIIDLYHKDYKDNLDNRGLYMTKVLIVTDSVRKPNVNNKVVELVESRLALRDGVEAQVADLGEIGLPFYDAPTPPSVDDYVIPHQSVQQWQDMVSQADKIIFTVPEYNHSLSAIQKNAIDWLYHEWKDKPVAFVAYGFYAGKHSLAQLEEMGSVLKWQVSGRIVGLQFTEDIDLDGTVIDKDGVESRLDEMIDDLVPTTVL